MASMNPEIYYEANEGENHGSYIYVSLEEMVNFFMQNFTGDESALGNVRRSSVISWMKQGIKQFTFSALKEVKGVELELGDTLDIIMPPDMVSWVRISYVNPVDGSLMVLSSNPNSVQATSYLQDHTAEVLFDDNGFILEGTTLFSELNDRNSGETLITGDYDKSTRWTIDPTVNANGTFHVDTRSGRIHFSSDNASRVLMLEYLSDGLEYSNESDIKISKLAEIALYNWTRWNIASNREGIQEYEIRRYEKDYVASFRNTKIKMMDLSITEVMLFLNAKKKYIK